MVRMSVRGHMKPRRCYHHHHRKATHFGSFHCRNGFELLIAKLTIFAEDKRPPTPPVRSHGGIALKHANSTQNKDSMAVHAAWPWLIIHHTLGKQHQITRIRCGRLSEMCKTRNFSSLDRNLSFPTLIGSSLLSVTVHR
ncbi:hypothetical protein B296_00013903 [Ensete ventricosum]|uniref:Uncharacterized protein n=1 Tax=Ensete ventricosum TaxID=4639 RepID=A0A427B198_ENSVE|nr:hypothetical protein B296_00013903 [Ensete ventricosum]